MTVPPLLSTSPRLLLAAWLALTLSSVQADIAVTNDPSGVITMELRHEVTIPAILYFRLGPAQEGIVDKVIIDVESSPGFSSLSNGPYAGNNPLGNSQAIAATSNGDIVVDIRANFGTVAITYNFNNSIGGANGLSDGNGNFIPWDQIATTSADPGNLPAPVLSNSGGTTGVMVFGHEHQNLVIDRQTTWTYSYKNEVPAIAGSYEGTVTYTVGVP